MYLKAFIFSKYTIFVVSKINVSKFIHESKAKEQIFFNPENFALTNCLHLCKQKDRKIVQSVSSISIIVPSTISFNNLTFPPVLSIAFIFGNMEIIVSF